jgi:hypothetical protein
MTKESLTEEIIANARRDRKRLEAAADGLTHGFSRKTATEDEDEPLDPEVAAAFAEEIAGLSEALTNVNKQLVELVKLENRSAPPAEDPTRLSKQQVDDVFDEIQPQEAN